MKPQADAQAAVKGAAKGRKAAKRQGAAGSGQGFRTYTSPGGLQVRPGSGVGPDSSLSRLAQN